MRSAGYSTLIALLCCSCAPASRPTSSPAPILEHPVTFRHHAPRAKAVSVGQGDFRARAGVPLGTFRAVAVPSRALGGDVEATLYRPPNARGKPPVLVLLHGRGGGRDQWLQSVLLINFLDNLLYRGRVEPMMVLLPSLSSHEKSGDGLVTFLPRELPAWLDAHAQIKAGPGARALGGFSLGGTRI